MHIPSSPQQSVSLKLCFVRLLLQENQVVVIAKKRVSAAFSKESSVSWENWDCAWKASPPVTHFPAPAATPRTIKGDEGNALLDNLSLLKIGRESEAMMMCEVMYPKVQRLHHPVGRER